MLDRSRIITNLYNLQVSAIENNNDEISLLLTAYNYLATECQRVDPSYAQQVLDDLVALHNGQLDGEQKQALIYINTSTVSKRSYSSALSTHADNIMDDSPTFPANIPDASPLTQISQFATMSDHHKHSPLRLKSILGVPNPKNISALVFKVTVVLIATTERIYTIILPQTPIIEMSSRHLREFGSRHFLRVEFVVSQPPLSELSPQGPVNAYGGRYNANTSAASAEDMRKHKLNKKPVIADERILHSITRAGFPSFTNRRFVRPSHSSIIKKTIYKLLTTGIYLGGSLFIYYAQGSGQLKEQQCWFIRAPDYEAIYKGMQNFSEFIKDFKYYHSFYANMNSRLHSFYISPILPNIPYLDSVLNRFLRPRAVIFREFATSWLGDIKEVQPCKICTRRGLCFGKSLPTIKIKKEYVQIIPDKRYGNYIFTDGAGEISYDLMLEVALCLDKIRIDQLDSGKDKRNVDERDELIDSIEVKDKYFADSENITLNLQIDQNIASGLIRVPSAVQIRWAGAKGMLILNALLPPRTILLHESQVKYNIPNPTETQQTLEILRVAQPSKGMINMQIIVLLSEMGVPDDAILHIVQQDLQKILVFLNPTDHCKNQADLYQLVNRMSRSGFGKLILQMLMAGIDIAEPCLQFLLMKLQMLQLRSMRANMRFHVPDSRILIGIYDCFDLLHEGEVYIGLCDPLVISKWSASTHLKTIQDSIEKDTPVSAGPYLQTSDMAFGVGASCIEGNVVVAKNPCFYRGDVRVYKAVNLFDRLKAKASDPNIIFKLPFFATQVAIKAMYRGVICFPKHYEGRPMTDCLSGSDLDGDIYWVSWDASILGTIRYEYEPASFQARPGEIEAHAPNLTDIKIGLANLLRTEGPDTNNSESNWPCLQELKLEQFYSLSSLLRKKYISLVLEEQCSKGVDLKSKKILYSKVIMQPVELIIKEAFILEWVSGAFFDNTIGRIGSELKVIGDMLGYSHPLTIELGRQFFFALDSDKTGWRRKATFSAHKLLEPSFNKLYQSLEEDAKKDCSSESVDSLSDCSDMINEVVHRVTSVYNSCLIELSDSISAQSKEATDSLTDNQDEHDSSSHSNVGSLHFIFSDIEPSSSLAEEPHLKVQSAPISNLKKGLEEEMHTSSLVNTISQQSNFNTRDIDTNKRIVLKIHSYKLRQSPSKSKTTETNKDAENSPAQKNKTKLSISAIAHAHTALNQLIASKKKKPPASNQINTKLVHIDNYISKVSIIPNWMIGNAITGLFYPTHSDWLKLKNKIVYHSSSVAGSIYNLITAGENSSINILRKCISFRKKSFFQAIIDTLRPISAVLPSDLSKIKNYIEKNVIAPLFPLPTDFPEITSLSDKDSLVLLGIQRSVFQDQIDVSRHIFGSIIADFNSLSQIGKLRTDIKSSAYSRMTSIYSSQLRNNVSDEERRARAVILYYLFYTHALIQLLPVIKYYEKLHGELEIQDIYSNSSQQDEKIAKTSLSTSNSSDESGDTLEEADDVSQESSTMYEPDVTYRKHKNRILSEPSLNCCIQSPIKYNSKSLIVQYVDSISSSRALIGIHASPDDRLVWNKYITAPLYKTPASSSVILCNRYAATGIELPENKQNYDLGKFSDIPSYSDINKYFKTLGAKKLSVVPPTVSPLQQKHNENDSDMCVAYHLSVAKLSCRWPVSMTNPTIAFSRYDIKDQTIFLWKNSWKSFLKAQLTLLQAQSQNIQKVPVSALLRQQSADAEQQNILILTHSSNSSDIEQPFCEIHRDLMVETFDDEDVMGLQEQINNITQVHADNNNASDSSALSSSYSSSDDNLSTILSEKTPSCSEKSESEAELISESNDDGSNSNSSSTKGSSDGSRASHSQRAPATLKKIRPTYKLLHTGKLSIKDIHSNIDVSLKLEFFTRNSLVKINGCPDLKLSRFTKSYALIQKKYIDALQICQIVWDLCGPELCEAFVRCRHQYMHAVSPELFSLVNVRPSANQINIFTHSN